MTSIESMFTMSPLGGEDAIQRDGPDHSGEELAGDTTVARCRSTTTAGTGSSSSPTTTSKDELPRRHTTGAPDLDVPNDNDEDFFPVCGCQIYTFGNRGGRTTCGVCQIQWYGAILDTEPSLAPPSLIVPGHKAGTPDRLSVPPPPRPPPAGPIRPGTHPNAALVGDDGSSAGSIDWAAVTSRTCPPVPSWPQALEQPPRGPAIQVAAPPIATLPAESESPPEVRDSPDSAGSDELQGRHFSDAERGEIVRRVAQEYTPEQQATLYMYLLHVCGRLGDAVPWSGLPAPVIECARIMGLIKPERKKRKRKRKGDDEAEKEPRRPKRPKRPKWPKRPRKPRRGKGGKS